MQAFAHAASALRSEHPGLVIVVNGENARNGSGLSPDNYKTLRRAGADAITLGDHCFKDSRIAEFLDDGEKPVARPANLARTARGKSRILIPPGDAARDAPGLAIITVLGRLFMSLPADDPFAAADRELERLASDAPDALAIIEVHGEATSEKAAMAWHCLAHWPQRVIGVVGTHTHVQTADARVLDGRLGAMTDLGMCGGRRGVIGRQIEPVLSFMTRQTPASFHVADGDPAATGCLLQIDTASRRCVSIDPLLIPTPDPVGGR